MNRIYSRVSTCGVEQSPEESGKLIPLKPARVRLATNYSRQKESEQSFPEREEHTEREREREEGVKHCTTFNFHYF